MNCSKRAPSFGIVWTCFMVSPQEGHTRTGVLSGTSGGHSMTGIEGVPPTPPPQPKPHRGSALAPAFTISLEGPHCSIS